jgi:hypothetical protein
MSRPGRWAFGGDMALIMTVGDLKQELKDLPDDTHLVIDETGDYDFAELRVAHILAATEELPPCVILEMGQIWNHELDLDKRFNEHIGFDPDSNEL